MKITALLAFLLLTLITTLSADQGRGDLGTLKMTWDEFHNQITEKSGVAFGKAFFNTHPDTEWSKYEIRFDVTNKSVERRRIRFLITIFDKTNNMVFAASEDKGIDGLGSKEFNLSTKVSSTIKFEPETVFIRCWWE